MNGARVYGATALIGLLLGVTACAASGPKYNYERIDQRKQEIAVLWGQIREWRQNAGLRGRGAVRVPRSSQCRPSRCPRAKAICPDDTEPETQECKDVCSLAEAICENAESICRISVELGNDPWAQDKCSSSKASCKQAKQRCCGCRKAE